MRRRDFLKSMAIGSTMMSGSMLTFSRALAADSDRLYVFITAGGGWDVTSICDPKGDSSMTNYAIGAIRTAGNIQYAPVPDGVTPPSVDWMDTFFQTHYQRLTVFNGVDHQTNGHSVGTRALFTGTLDLGIPALGAMVAAPFSSSQSLAFLVMGGYAGTEGILPPSRLPGMDMINGLTTPNPYLSDTLYSKVSAARQTRLNELISRNNSAALQKNLLEFRDARESDQNLGSLLDNLPAVRSTGAKGDMEIAVSALASGLSTAVNMYVGGFDSHADNDARQVENASELFESVDHLWNQLGRFGLQSRTTIVIGSEFGRTPWYNDGNGKDHWPTGSMIVMADDIPGNRVIGATNDSLLPIGINPTTLQLDNSGTVIRPAHIHKALRRRAGIGAEHPLDQKFALAADEIDFFS